MKPSVCSLNNWAVCLLLLFLWHEAELQPPGRPGWHWSTTVWRHFYSGKPVDTVIRHQRARCHCEKPHSSNGDVEGRVGPKYDKRMRGYERALTKIESVIIKNKNLRYTLWRGSETETEGGGAARLHFRLRSAKLKGGPCTNETQFHATLSLPVLFPGFHFH